MSGGRAAGGRFRGGPQERSYRGKLPADRKFERRRRLVGAGLELFGTKGYVSTTIAELCREAGVAPVKFYEEFQNKEAVLLAVAEEIGADALDAVLDALKSAMAAAGAGTPDLLAVARVGLSAFCRSLLDDPRRARVFVLEVVGVSAEVERRRRLTQERFAGLVLRTLWSVTGAPPGGIRPPDRERIVSTALVGGTNEAISAWLLDPAPPGVEVLVENLAELYAVVATWLSDRRS